MKQKLHNITAVFMAFIVLFSSFSYTVNKHVCQGEVQAISFFVEASSCEMETKMDGCEMDADVQSCDDNNLCEKDCCQDISVFVKGNDTHQQAQDYTPSFTQLEFVAAFAYSFVFNLQIATELPSFFNYRPPSLFRDFQSLLQIFRI